MTTTIRSVAAMATSAQARLQTWAQYQNAARRGEAPTLNATGVRIARAAEHARLEIAAEHFAALPAANDAAMPALEPA